MVSANILLLSAGAAALLSATFLFGGSLHPLRPVLRDDRSMISFGAGMSSPTSSSTCFLS